MPSLILKTIAQVRRVIIAVIGFTVLAIGIALIVLPGPAFIVIPAGLAILSIEFAWAKRLLRSVKEKIIKETKALGLGGKAAPERKGDEKSG